MNGKEFIEKIGALAHEDMKRSGVLASVTTAQAALESAYGASELAVNAFNLFGMKASLSGNTWPSAWDGAVYEKKTKEQRPDGSYYEVVAKFRKYKSIEESIRDHSDYLTGARNGSALRYAGIVGESNYYKAASIIKSGGYATSLSYVSALCTLITSLNLTRFDKEVNTMNIIESTGTHGMYTGARTIQYIVIHYTAGVTSKKGAALNTANWFRNPNAGGTADFIVDDEQIVKYNPDPKNYSCWAVGGGKYGTKGGSLYGKANNRNCVSIEICSSNKTGKVTNPNDGNFYFTSAAVDRAVELTRYLMNLYGIPADRVIRHYDVNGKLCPGIIGWNADSGDESAWNAFKARIGASSGSAQPATPSAPSGGLYRVRKLWNDPASQIGAYSSLENAKRACSVGYTVYDGVGRAVYTNMGNTQPAASSSFKWAVTVSDLRIRKGAGVLAAWTGKYTGRGTFTIVEEKNGWGRLKSGAGWISLSTKYGHRV